MAQTSLQYFLQELEHQPTDLKLAVLSVDFLAGLKEIQQSKNLHIDQAAALEETTFKIMLGEIDVDEYQKELSSKMRIGPREADELAVLVNQKVLDPIRVKFQEIQQEDAEAAEVDEFLNTPAEKLNKQEEPEDHSQLKAEDLLSEIENPQPSVSVVHETVLPVDNTPKPQNPVLKTPPISTSTANSTPSTIQPAPANIIQPTQQTPAQQIANKLNTKLTEQTVSKPEQIRSSIDPYKEPVL